MKDLSWKNDYTKTLACLAQQSVVLFYINEGQKSETQLNKKNEYLSIKMAFKDINYLALTTNDIVEIRDIRAMGQPIFVEEVDFAIDSVTWSKTSSKLLIGSKKEKVYKLFSLSKGIFEVLCQQNKDFLGDVVNFDFIPNNCVATTFNCPANEYRDSSSGILVDSYDKEMYNLSHSQKVETPGTISNISMFSSSQFDYGYIAVISDSSKKDKEVKQSYVFTLNE